MYEGIVIVVLQLNPVIMFNDLFQITAGCQS